MEMELNLLIEKIKQDGVFAANKEAGSIIASAEEKARKIINEAEAKKEAILRDADLQAQNFKKTSEKTVKQAARDVLLTLRERVTDFFHRVIKIKVSEALEPEILKQLIVKTVEAFKKEGAIDLEIMLSPEDRLMLEKTLFAALGEEARKNITIISSNNLDKGFRIGEKGKNSYFDFTDEALAKSFKDFLTPKLIEVLDVGFDEQKLASNDK